MTGQQNLDYKFTELECPILNEYFMAQNQSVTKGMGGDVGHVRSPGIKVQIYGLNYFPAKPENVLCPRRGVITESPVDGRKDLRLGVVCSISNKFCIYCVSN